jgi:uncharacterized protein (DUF302 family)
VVIWRQRRTAASGIEDKENINTRRTVMINYGFTKELDIPYETVVEQVREALKKEGFGVLTEIDVKEKMKEKLGLDMRKYIILGACNPPNAYKAILAEENIGLMLPCNVIVYEKGSKTVLSVIRPTVAMQMIDNVKLQKLAEAVEGQLKEAFDAVK